MERSWEWHGRVWPVGRQLVITVEDYRKGRDSLERPTILCRHWSGALYYHVTTCGGRLVGPVSAPPDRLEPYQRPLDPPLPRQRKGGCRGCGKG